MNTKYPNLKIAIIGSNEDRDYAKIFKNSLRPLVPEVWTYNDILVGDTISKSIFDQVKSADVIVILLSTDFFYELYSGEGYNSDLPKLLADINDQGKILCPILLRSCIWDSIELGNFFDEQAIMPERKALLSLSLEERDEAMTSIIKAIDATLYKLSSKLIRIVIPNWIGYIGGVAANNGFSPDLRSNLTAASTKLV